MDLASIEKEIDNLKINKASQSLETPSKIMKKSSCGKA